MGSPTTASLARSFARFIRTPSLRSAFINWLKLLYRGEGDQKASLSWWFERCTLYAPGFAERFNQLMETNPHGALQHLECCDHCEQRLFFEGEGTLVDEEQVCSHCLNAYFFHCPLCEEWANRNDLVEIENYGFVCQDCARGGSIGNADCAVCGLLFLYEDLTEVDGQYYCEGDAPVEECKPQHLEFEFPALCTPNKSVKNDEVAVVTVGEGDISEEGMRAIRQFVYSKTSARSDMGGIMSYGMDMTELEHQETFDRRWQTKEGNFTKRFAKHMLVRRSLKLTEEAMAEVGNLAKAHAGKGGSHHLSLTRDLNLPRAEFVNDGSCWWTEYAHSRCEFKAWYGFGVRTFRDNLPITRAWLLPLTATLPAGSRRVIFGRTHELPADAYVLFNAYGMDQLAYARIIAGMVGKSYKKLDVFEAGMYINASGILIAEQSICDTTLEISLPKKRTCQCHNR